MLCAGQEPDEADGDHEKAEPDGHQLKRVHGGTNAALLVRQLR